MKYWILAALACGMCLVNVWHTCHDIQDYGGTDLRVRVVGARALVRGVNPYTIKDTEDLDPALRDPDQGILSRCTYPPTLLAVYAPLASLTYPLQRAIWAVLEWCAFAGSVALLSACLKSPQARFWFSVTAIGLLGGSSSWRLHVERGQYYVFVVLFVSIGMLLLLKTRHSLAAGFFWGMAICLRPTALFLVLPWLTGSQRRVGFMAIATALVAVAGTTYMGEMGYWLDFLKLSRAWELSLLGAVIEGHADNPVISRPTDGYNTAIMGSYAANLTFVSLSRSLQTLLDFCVDPIVMARIGKIVWLIAASMIWKKHLNTRQQQPVQTESQLLVGVCLMLVTDYFLPIRIEYADVMFLIPMALLTPLLMRREYRVLTVLAIIALLIHKAPLSSLPFNASAASSMLRSFVVVYILVRFTILGLPELNCSPESDS